LGGDPPRIEGLDDTPPPAGPDPVDIRAALTHTLAA
jgi:hypothetical protein